MTILMIPIIFIIDQWTKNKAENELKQEDRRYYAKKSVSLSLVYNKGAFLGFLKNKPFFLHIFTIATLVLIVIMAIPYWFLGKGKLTGLGFSLMLGGALGNYADRVRKGYVVDFIAFKPKHKVHFNLADFAIFKGALLTVIGQWFGV